MQVIVVYILFGAYVFTYISCEPFHLNPQCMPSTQISIESPLVDAFHSFTAGSFVASFSFVVIQLLDADNTSMMSNSQRICTCKHLTPQPSLLSPNLFSLCLGLINFVALVGHTAIALKVTPILTNVFGRLVFIPRLLEWVSLGTLTHIV